MARTARALAGTSGRCCSAPQKKRWRFRPAGVPSDAGVEDTVRPGCRDARDATHGFVETAVLQQVERGTPHGLVNGQEQGAGADLVALVEVAHSRQHPADRSIVVGGNGLAVRPMMDASTRHIEQVAEFFPRQAGSAADLHDGVGRGFRRNMLDLPDRAGGGALGAQYDRLPGVGRRRPWKHGGNQRDGEGGVQGRAIHAADRRGTCVRCFA